MRKPVALIAAITTFCLLAQFRQAATEPARANGSDILRTGSLAADLEQLCKCNREREAVLRPAAGVGERLVETGLVVQLVLNDVHVFVLVGSEFISNQIAVPIGEPVVVRLSIVGQVLMDDR